MLNQQRTLIAAIVERIIPMDNESCVQVEVVDYVLLLLKGKRGGVSEIQLLDFLGDIDRLSRFEFGRNFLKCDGEQRDQVIAQLLDLNLAAANYVFRQLVFYSLEGWLREPDHGENGYGIGWDYVGFGRYMGNRP